jgi:hypothetical protein
MVIIGLRAWESLRSFGSLSWGADARVVRRQSGQHPDRMMRTMLERHIFCRRSGAGQHPLYDSYELVFRGHAGVEPSISPFLGPCTRHCAPLFFEVLAYRFARNAVSVQEDRVPV